MSLLELAWADGQLAAMRRPKTAWLAATHPTVQQSSLLKSKATPAQPALPPPPSTPDVISNTFDRHEQGETRVEPRRKLSAAICSTCRKAKHYGSCKRPIPIKRADFNLGMTPNTSSDSPSMSPGYHSATSADSALARARDGRPADEQAASGFADLYRNLGISNQADQSTQNYEGLTKVSVTLMELGLGTAAAVPALAAGIHDRSGKSALGAGLGGVAGGALGGMAGFALDRFVPGAPILGYLGGTTLGAFGGRHIANKLSGFMLPGSETHSVSEQLGPSVNPYEERLTIKSPPIAAGTVGDQAIAHAFGQVDRAPDVCGISAAGTPASGPIA